MSKVVGGWNRAPARAMPSPNGGMASLDRRAEVPRRPDLKRWLLTKPSHTHTHPITQQDYREAQGMATSGLSRLGSPTSLTRDWSVSHVRMAHLHHPTANDGSGRNPRELSLERGVPLEMFLSKKLAKRERTGQHSRSKQGLSCPGFFLSIPVLNGLSDRSKPVQGFSHAVFHQFFSCFQPVLPVKPVQKLMRRLNYIIFDRDLTVFCQNPFNAVLRLCFSLSRGRFFLSSICQVCQSTLIERV